ncbi:MAG TPA: proline--tRNA ligase [Methanoregulaceae archaeon]|nr:proline--tRNA ligase [Methanoregulaceae archaeon]
MEEERGALPKKTDFSAWYNELLWQAEVMDVRYPVKGLYVWYPHGFALRKHVYARLRELMDRDHQETLFPLLIPEQEFMKEAEHIKGFEDEVYWVTHGGKDRLDVPLALRPTSETAIYPMYALWVRSHADLPIRLYQVVNTFRYETKHTRPLIRLREITSFKEAHTVHATWEQAEIQVEEAIRLYQEFYERLGIPVIVSRRPDWDKFPGADYTMAVDTIMPDGKTLQIGTVHHLGDHFSQTFNITFEDPEGLQRHVYQTCYGISERSIAALISLHGDDKGLILPPDVAPVQIVIVPITIGKRKEEVTTAAAAIEQELKSAGYRVKIDGRDLRPGAKYYYWEMRGVSLRLEIGPRDIDASQVTVVTRTDARSVITRKDLIAGIREVISDETCRMKERAEEHVKSRLIISGSMEEAKHAIEQGIALVQWCEEKGCADVIEEDLGASVLGTRARSPHLKEQEGPCVICGKPGKTTLVGRAY